MNFIVAALLLHLDPSTNDSDCSFEYIENCLDEKVFWILVHIMHEKKWDGFFKNVHKKLLKKKMYIFTKIIFFIIILGDT